MTTGMEEEFFFEWEKPLVSLFFPEFQGLSFDLEEVDSWIWKDGEFPIYTIKSAYNCLRRAREGENVSAYKKFWRSKVVPSTLVSTWRVLENKIVTMVNLERREITVKSLFCSLCGMEEENCRHLVFECIIAWSVWCQYFAWLSVKVS